MNNNFNFKKSLGQNFLHDKNIIHKIVESANVDKNTLVIEIGPGSGALTLELVPKSKHTILYEADNRLEIYLRDLLQKYNNYTLFLGDFLDTDVNKDIKNIFYDKIYVVANLPYYITTPIIMKFIDDDILPDKMVIMVQKEVASRLAANIGSRDYGSFTVLLNYYYDINKLFDVSRNCFIPKPNVDSAVLSMSLKKNRLKVNNISLFKKIVRDSFSMKRKTLRNNLKNYDLDVIERILLKYGLSLSDRAEKVSLEAFIDICNNL